MEDLSVHCEFAQSIMMETLLKEKGEYSNKLESFNSYANRKLQEAQQLDEEFVKRLKNGANLVHEHFKHL
jgi:hypothetical protein